MRPVILLFLGIGWGVVGCSGTHDAPQEAAPHRAVRAAPAPAPAAPALRVPELLRLSIDELNRRLGPRLPVPVGFVDPVLVPVAQRNEPLDSTTLFRRRGLAIVASYDHRSRQVSSLLLLGSNENELMRRAQLQLGAESYLVLPVFKERPATELLGLRVLAMSLNQ